MPEQLDAIIQRVVGEVVESHLADLRAEIARRVGEQLDSIPSDAQGAGITDISAALIAMQNVTTQAEILGALLTGAAAFAGRVALFVIRAGSAIGWQGRGVDEQALKTLHLSIDRPALARMLQMRAKVSVPAREVDDAFVTALGLSGDESSSLFPLLVKDKVAAVLYADAGAGGGVNSSALEVLVRFAGLWLEAMAVRKAGGAPAAVSERSPAEAMIAPAERVAESVSTLTGTPSAVAAPPAPGAPVEVEVAIPHQDQEVHNKARRFAKLLVDEIKLYNQSKVKEGREHKDLYDRLKDDIDKSRTTYEKRYGGTAAASGDYFHKELIRILADNDSSVLGGNYPG